MISKSWAKRRRDCWKLFILKVLWFGREIDLRPFFAKKASCINGSIERSREQSTSTKSAWRILDSYSLQYNNSRKCNDGRNCKHTCCIWGSASICCAQPCLLLGTCYPALYSHLSQKLYCPVYIIIIFWSMGLRCQWPWLSRRSKGTKEQTLGRQCSLFQQLFWVQTDELCRVILTNIPPCCSQKGRVLGTGICYMVFESHFLF